MTLTVLEAFHRVHGYKVANPDPTEAGVDELRYFLGYSKQKKIWAVAIDTATGDTALLRFDEHGFLEKKILHTGANYVTGAIDGYGNIWVSDLAVPELRRIHHGSGKILDTITLNDGADDHNGLGLLWVPADSIEEGRLWCIGKNVNTDTTRCFKINVGLATQEAFSAGPLGSLGPLHERIAMAFDPDERRVFGTTRNATNGWIRFDRATLVGTNIAAGLARNLPITGLHYAFGSFWMGAWGTAATPLAQITRVDRNGNLEATLLTDAAMAVTGFAHDAQYVYAALTANVGGVQTAGADNRNRIAKIDPSTNTVVEAFPFGGSARTNQDGVGDRVLDLIAVSEPAKLPQPWLLDAALWWRGDDPDAEYTGFGVGTHFVSFPNRGPQSPFGNFIDCGSSATRPEVGTLNTLQAPFFDGTQDMVSSLTTAASTWSLLHDGTGMTLILVLHPTDAVAGAQDIINTMTALSTSNIGIRVVYDGPNERVRVQIANGEGVGYVVDEDTPNNEVPVNETTILTIVFNEGAVGDRFTMRSVREAPSEPRELVSSAGTSEEPSSANATGVLTVANESVFFEGYIPECALIRGVLLEYQQRSLEKYLARWQP
jgi:hypothetical protein